MCEARCVAREELHPDLYQYLDAEAVAHLMYVAAGLDSQVIGEPQILGQVTRALELARGQGAVSLDGKMVDMPVAARARKLVELSAAIELKNSRG